MKTKVLIADQDVGRTRYIAAMLKTSGHEPVIATDGRTAAEMLGQARKLGIGVAMLDLALPDIDTVAVIRSVRAAGHRIPIIALATEETVARALEATRVGATDFLCSPVGPERLEVSIANALALSRLSGEVRWLSRSSAPQLDFGDIVASSEVMRQTVTLARRAARSDLSVLIHGECGTGKETFARAIHGASARAESPFVAVNCGAVPADSIGPILFGRRKDDAPGKLAEAGGGTLFLDDVDELPLDAQAELVRTIEIAAQPANGNGRTVPGLRIVSATQRDLGAMVRRQTFRDDLYYRLSVFPLALPPLRERREDIPLLARRFLERYVRHGEASVEGFTRAALDALGAAAWPGNVTELESCVHRAVIMADGTLVDVGDLRGLDRNGAGETLAANGHGETNGERPSAAAKILIGEDGHIRRLFDIEKDAIKLALTLYRGRMSETARRLGIGRSTLYRKIDDLQLDRNGD